MINGVGYDSKRKYIAVENSKRTYVYSIWVNMLRRVYDTKLIEKNTWYKDVTVNKEWHDFQNFAEWYYSNLYSYGDNEVLELDKDIIRCREYGPNDCLLIPRKLNLMAIASRNGTSFKYPGIYKNGNKYGYRVGSISNRPYYERKGCFLNPEDAYRAFKEAKTKIVRSYAKEFEENVHIEHINNEMVQKVLKEIKEYTYKINIYDREEK